jgi:hypothetical protein
MHGGTIKIIDSQQARLRNNYKNTKLKLLKTNAMNIIIIIISIQPLGRFGRNQSPVRRPVWL